MAADRDDVWHLFNDDDGHENLKGTPAPAGLPSPSIPTLVGKVICALTGKLGIMGKSFLAEAFAGEDNDADLPTIFVCHVPRLHSVAFQATGAISAFDMD